jgi:PAS domain-containing protein
MVGAMKRICAWCQKSLGEVESSLVDKHAISHGICRECALDVVSRSGLPLQEFLDALGVPVLVADPDMRIKTANKPAREILKKELSRIEGFRCGNVLNCHWALLPEGCGNTICCGNCAVRETVTETFETGQTIVKRLAQLNHEPEGQKINLLISTELFGNVVLLRIDEVS